MLRSPAQTVSLARADRRVLAADARARTDLPSFDTSAMDGWAVAGTGPWRLIGTVLAGQAPEIVLRPGRSRRHRDGCGRTAGRDGVWCGARTATSRPAR